jgi:hypothetical protein
MAQPGYSADLDPFNNYPVVENESPASAKMQIVFALDVTGSMGSLIGAAKEKIWAIASSLNQSGTSLDISMGIVAYRDRGDAFVTKIIELNGDLDLVYTQLMNLTAGGGGDTPESVNQALYDSINRMNWDKSQSTVRTVFLVGDCPPHMDYRDDVKYQETCRMARKKDIVINTVQMGTQHETTAIWQEIARLANGEHITTGMDVNQVAIATPYDDELKKKTQQLEQTKLYYGDNETRKEKEKVKDQKIQTVETMSSSSAARRGSYINSTDYDDSFYGTHDIVNDLESGAISLDTIDVKELPEEMQEMDDEERTLHVEEIVKSRKVLESEIDALVKDRDKYVETNVPAEVNEISLTNKVFNSIKIQAKKKNIKVEGKAKH